MQLANNERSASARIWLDVWAISSELIFFIASDSSCWNMFLAVLANISVIHMSFMCDRLEASAITPRYLIFTPCECNAYIYIYIYIIYLCKTSRINRNYRQAIKYIN